MMLLIFEQFILRHSKPDVHVPTGPLDNSNRQTTISLLQVNQIVRWQMTLNICVVYVTVLVTARLLIQSDTLTL